MSGDSSEESERPPSSYDEQKEEDRLIEASRAFSGELNEHVKPWITFSIHHLRSRLIVGLGAFIIVVPVATAVFMLGEHSIWAPVGIALSPFIFAVRTHIVQERAKNEGIGVEGSRGLEFTGLALSGILDRTFANLETARDVGRGKLGNRSKQSAVEAVHELSAVRMKARLIEQRRRVRIQLLKEDCENNLQSARMLALICPLTLVALVVATFAWPFLSQGPGAAWATRELAAVLALFTVSGLCAFFLPVYMARGFARTVERKLREALREGWEADLTKFDCTGRIGENLAEVLDEWEKWQLSLRHESCRQRVLS